MKRHRRLRTVLTTVTALLAACAAMLGTATAAPAQEPTAAAPAVQEASPLATISPGLYRLHPEDRWDCLRAGPANDPATNDTGVYLHTNSSCNDIYSIWLVQPSGYGSQYTQVRSYAYNRCLDADFTGGRLTGIVRLWTCHTGANQAWDFLGGTSAGRVCVAEAYYCRQVLDLRSSGDPNVKLARLMEPLDDSEYEFPPQRWEMRPVPLG